MPVQTYSEEGGGAAACVYEAAGAGGEGAVLGVALCVLVVRVPLLAGLLGWKGDQVQG